MTGRPSAHLSRRPAAPSWRMRIQSPGATAPRSQRAFRASFLICWTRPCAASARSIRGWDTIRSSRTPSCRKWKIWRARWTACWRTEGVHAMRMLLAFLLSAVLSAADRKIVINAVDNHNRWAFTDDALRDYRTAGQGAAIVLAKSPADMAREVVDADAV